MKTTNWTIHEVTCACAVTTDELSKWISRGLFRPSATARRGEWRPFDWRDLACLAAIAVLRKLPLPISAAARIISHLRDALSEMEEITETSGVFLFSAEPADANSGPSAGLTRIDGLRRMLMTGTVSVVIVDIAKVYHDAAKAISGRSTSDEVV